MDASICHNVLRPIFQAIKHFTQASLGMDKECCHDERGQDSFT
jgi:hypothetical protein